MLFNIFINNLDDESEYTHMKFTDNTKPDGAVNIQKGSATIQKELDRLEECADRNFIKFIKGKHKVLHLRQSSQCSSTGWALKGWGAPSQKAGREAEYKPDSA